MKPKRLFIASFIFKFLPASRCHNLKAKLLRWCGAKVGKNVEIFSSAKIHGTMDLEIGDNVFIGHEALILVLLVVSLKLATMLKLVVEVLW